MSQLVNLDSSEARSFDDCQEGSMDIVRVDRTAIPRAKDEVGVLPLSRREFAREPEPPVFAERVHRLFAQSDRARPARGLGAGLYPWGPFVGLVGNDCLYDV